MRRHAQLLWPQAQCQSACLALWVVDFGSVDCGGGSLRAFFWWPDAPPAAPGIAAVKDFPAEPKTAVGSMNHVAFDMDDDQLEASIGRLQAAGVHVSVPIVVNHDDSPMGVARDLHEGVWVRSVYFRDPNGIMLEFAAILRGFRPDDVAHAPARAVERASA